MKNIEIFKAISAIIFAELYETFPLPKKINASDIALMLEEELWDKSKSQDPKNQNIHNYIRKYSPAALAAPTIEWLANAGLISFTAKHNGTFQNVVLTLKGLESIEAETGRGESLLNAMTALMTESSKDIAKEQLKSVFSDILKWCVEKSPTLLQMAVKNI